MEGFGDRRQDLRFDITGTFWVSLYQTSESRLRNISTAGALVEVPAGPPWSSLRTMALSLRAGGVPIIGVVMHQSPEPSTPGRQLVGLEFIQMSPAALAELQAFVADSAAL